jgi:transcriptional regulator with XRE-family HTH domain
MSTILDIMGKKTALQSPKLIALLKLMGENIRLARLRRNLSSSMLAERAGMTRMTLYSIENGEPSVSLGAYANVLFCIGLEKDLSLIANDDEFGRKLQDAGLIRTRKSMIHSKKG